MELEGKKLGQYQIIEELGRGGMAVVYKAYQPSLNRYVAIKVLPPQFAFDRDFVERFLREARAAAALHHPNIVTIHDISHQDGTYFIVMEFVEGKTLDQLIADSGRLPPQRIQHIVSQVVDALEHAHQRGLIHRDIKPTNIIVDEQKNDRVTLMDFGLVRAAEDSGLTKTGTIVGTPEYMSPEQAEGEDIDHRTDIYSLGVVLFKMLTGRVPFSKSTPHAVLIAHMTQEPPSISTISPGLPRPVEAVVRKALAKNREQRYARVGDLGRDLEAAVRGEMPAGLRSRPRPRVEARPAAEPTVVSGSPPDRTGVKGWIWGLGVAGVLLMLTLCGVGAYALGFFPGAASASPTASPTSSPVAPTMTSAASGAGEETEAATATATATVMPTATVTPSSSPTPTPRASATPRATPTATDTPAPAPSPTVGATQAPQETAPPQATAPNLVGPAQGGTYKNPIGFQWGGSLGAGQSYQVTAIHRGSGHAVQSGALTGTGWSAELPGDRAGEWVWSVSVLEGGRSVATSSEGMFWFDPFGGGTDDGDGGDDGGDDGGPKPQPTNTPAGP